ncbi:MAG: ATP-binding cassette domain-containing protein [Acidimicrobiales bacterium]
MTTGLVVSGLHKRFGDVEALRGVDLEVQRGQLVGFLGPNGAGKTTTMRGILGLLAMDAGSVTWDGEAITERDRRRIGYMPQERGLYPRMRVHEHIAYIGRVAGIDAALADQRAEQWADRVGLADRGDDPIQELSTGNQQRVQLAVALVHEPDLLILDEPFAGLDPVAVAMLTEVMAEQVRNGTSVVFSSHQLDVVQDLAEHVTIVADGVTKATGTVSELRNRSPQRFLEIQWAGIVPQWKPEESVVQSAPAGVSRFVVPAESDAAKLIADASTVGDLAAVSYEPPGLDDVFLELVSM